MPGKKVTLKKLPGKKKPPTLTLKDISAETPGEANKIAKGKTKKDK